MTRSILYATAAAVLLPLSAHAQSADNPDDSLPEVVVTATRLPAIVADTPGARVIDREAIERRGAIFAADILSDVPGLSMTRSGASAGVAQVRLRGAAPGKTLVLIDGVPVNDASELNGAFDFSGFELAEIDRIEVLSGPQSSLWGSDAIGGVIAFTTREIDGLRAEAEAGSFETVRGRLAVGVAKDTWALGGYVSRFDSDGVSAADEADGNTEADGLGATTAGVKGRYAFAPAVQIDGSLRWSSSRGDIDGTPPPLYIPGDTPDTTEAEQWSGFGRLSVRAIGLDHQFSVSGSEIDRANDGDFASVFEAGREVYRWQAGGAALEDAVAFTLGAEREETEGSLSTGEVAGLGTTSVFGVARLALSDRLSVTGGLRFDDTDDFGSRTTGRVSAAWEVAYGFILSGAWGSGFKAPSISQALCDYCTGLPVFPALQPEQAEGFEAAVGWSSQDDRISARLTAYRLEIEDQISWYSVPNSWDGYYINVVRARTDGVELESSALLGAGFNLSLAWAWTDARDQTTGARLLRIPERAGSATLGWTGERLSAALTVRAEGDQDDAGGVRKAFVTANLNGSYVLTDHAVLTVRIENLADEHYQQVFGYGEPGRSAYLGIRLRY